MFQDVNGPTSGRKACRIDPVNAQLEVSIGHGKNKVLEVINLKPFIEAYEKQKALKTN